MSGVFKILANSVGVLGSSTARAYPRGSSNPFKEDRKNLAGDWLKVQRDIQRSIEKVKHGSETRRS